MRHGRACRLVDRALLRPSTLSEIRSVLAERWREDFPDAEELLAWLLQRWEEPHRRYHDLRHLHECLDALELLGSDQPERLGAWFHDVVYDGEPVRDEQRSAALSRTWLTRLNLDPGLIDEVERLVLMTIEHDPAAEDGRGHILSDADLAILGSAPERYRQSVADIRLEYSRFDDEQWRAGRARVLDGFLARPQIFRTELGLTRWEKPARANIGRELANL